MNAKRNSTLKLRKKSDRQKSNGSASTLTSHPTSMLHLKKRQKFVRRSSGYVNSQAGIFAVVDIKKGDLVCDWTKSVIQPKKTSHTTQIDVDKNILYDTEDFQYYNQFCTLFCFLSNYLACSCDPNFYHDFKQMKSFALRDIKIGEELTRFYCCNEWQMVSPFACSCGAERCCKYIAGAKHVSLTKLQEYAPYLAPHIQKLVRKDIDNLLSKL